VANLGKGQWKRSLLHSRVFFRFFSQPKQTKDEFILPRMDLKKWFLPMTISPLEKKASPSSKILDSPLPYIR